MSESNVILNHIVSITESRDMEILEISLLWTIFELLECINVYLVKVSRDDSKSNSISGYGPDGYRDRCELDSNPEMKKLAESFMTDSGDTRGIEAGKYNGYTVVPIDIMKNQIGFIALEIPAIINPNTQLLEGLVRIYQNYVSILLDNQTDTLTGILNRKTFDDRIMKLIELKKRQKDIGAYNNERRGADSERFWLGIFDIDNFKKVNDTFGHIYGDEILILISRIMQHVFRAADMKFRFGGEEFIVVIKAEDREAAFCIFERFRHEVENYRFPQTGKITVSIGITEITGEETPSVFVGCADKAMYYAKENGRNMTCVYSDLVERGLIAPEAVKRGDVILFD